MAVLAAAPLTGRLAVAAAPARVLPSFVAAPAAARLLATRAKAPLAAEPVEDDLDEDVLGNEPAAVQRRVLRLKELQKDYDGINREFQKELALLQAKYLEKYQPVFDKRRDVVLGKAPVDKYDVEDDGEADKGIQEFWLTAFYNHDKVGAYITERDAEVLKHLVDVSAEVLTGDERGFQLVFHFDDNKYFSNKTLTKRYVVEPEDDIIPKQFIGCEINWKDVSLNPTVEQKKKRVKSKEAGKGGKPAFVVETEPVESFFNIFEPPQIPSNPEDLNEDELEALQEELTADFDIGFAIKDQIVPRAVEWFTGELSSFEDYDEEMEGDEYEEDYEEPEPPAPSAGRSSRR